MTMSGDLILGFPLIHDTSDQNWLKKPSTFRNMSTSLTQITLPLQEAGYMATHTSVQTPTPEEMNPQNPTIQLQCYSTAAIQNIDPHAVLITRQ